VGSLVAGARLALTTLTVLPLPPGRVDRGAARAAMLLAPIVGAVLGVLAAAALAGLVRLGAAPLLAAGLTVAGLALATRGLHLDGLADTADGLGSAAPPVRALAIMRSPEAGPFGVAALVLTLLVQTAALAQLAAASGWIAAGLGVAVGRVGLVWGCRRGVPAARPDGLGAMVAGVVPGWACLLWTAAAAAVGLLAGGPAGAATVVAAAAAGAALVGHARRRLGGVTGDVLGAAAEMATLASWVLLALAG
jgi:adenosylcobinamide-GDP ribazoletransferase